jgi:hypothetical protein
MAWSLPCLAAWVKSIDLNNDSDVAEFQASTQPALLPEVVQLLCMAKGVVLVSCTQ